jgi:hypothetical protein
MVTKFDILKYHLGHTPDRLGHSWQVFERAVQTAKARYNIIIGRSYLK